MKAMAKVLHHVKNQIILPLEFDVQISSFYTRRDEICVRDAHLFQGPLH